MDAAYISALAALAGSTLGGLTSVASSWLTQYVQLRTRQQSHDLIRREELYKSFIEEASRLYGDALEHDDTKVSNLVTLYALISRMRMVSSPRIVENADGVVRDILDTYLSAKKTLRDVAAGLDSDAMNPLLKFSNACREELLAYDAVAVREGEMQDRRL